jgi:hypothetical protein
MADKIRFEAFESRLAFGRLTEDEARRYLELDPTSPRVKIRLRSEAPIDGVPDGFDADAAVYEASQKQATKKAASIKKASNAVRVVAEGDSWFRLPGGPIGIFVPDAIGQILSNHKRLNVVSVARWGDTLAQMLNKKDYLKALADHKPTWFILSAGGNDLADALAADAFLHQYSVTRPIPQSISPQGKSLLTRIGEMYRSLLQDVRRQNPNVKILGYCYDLPQPEVGSGKHIGQHLRRLQYPMHTWDELMVLVMGEMTTVIQRELIAFDNSVFLDCRGVSVDAAWWDDMHPETNGFKLLAKKFEAVLLPAGPSPKSKAKKTEKANKRPKIKLRARQGK